MSDYGPGSQAFTNQQAQAFPDSPAYRSPGALRNALSQLIESLNVAQGPYDARYLAPEAHGDVNLARRTDQQSIQNMMEALQPLLPGPMGPQGPPTPEQGSEFGRIDQIPTPSNIDALRAAHAPQSVVDDAINRMVSAGPGNDVIAWQSSLGRQYPLSQGPVGPLEPQGYYGGDPRVESYFMRPNDQVMPDQSQNPYPLDPTQVGDEAGYRVDAANARTKAKAKPSQGHADLFKLLSMIKQHEKDGSESPIRKALREILGQFGGTAPPKTTQEQYADQFRKAAAAGYDPSQSQGPVGPMGPQPSGPVGPVGPQGYYGGDPRVESYFMRPDNPSAG